MISLAWLYSSRVTTRHGTMSERGAEHDSTHSLGQAVRGRRRQRSGLAQWYNNQVCEWLVETY